MRSAQTGSRTVVATTHGASRSPRPWPIAWERSSPKTSPTSSAPSPRDDVKGRFIAIVNECAKESEPFEWTAEGPDYAFLCFLGHRVADIMTDQDRTWAISQVIEVEAPEAAANLHRGMAGLLDQSPRRRERGARATGE